MVEENRKEPDDDKTQSVDGFARGPDQPRIERLGPFKLEATLGSGGMGTIYRAYDESMKRTVALKVLHASLEISKSAQARFVREAWIAGRLDHPNIIKVHTRGEENRISYIAMELAENGSLSDYLKQTSESIPADADVSETTDRNYINLILEKFIGLAKALEHIHAQGFIHRDIKPHNILLAGPDNDFKLTDFGIAHAEDMTRMTRAGDFIGTVRYMSPELIAAHRGEVDKRTDIYSLGVTLYEALTLTLPFKAVSEEKLISEILAGRYIEARKTNRRISRDLETVLMKATHHDPNMRYQSATEFADDLQRIIDGRPIVAKRQSLVSRGSKYVRRNYKVVLGIAAAVIIVVGGFMWQHYQAEKAYRSAIDTAAQQVHKQDMVRKPKLNKIVTPPSRGQCALSPDGERLAFMSKDKGLWVAPTHGTVDPTTLGEPVKLAEVEIEFLGGSLPVWSADGKWIAFNARDTLDNVPNRWFSMFVIPSGGGELREVPVKHDGSRDWYSYQLSLSPDGQTIAFSADTSFIPGETKTGCIYSIPVAGGQIKRLTDSLCTEPAYSPDGEMLAYVQACPPLAQDDDWQYEIRVVPVDGGTPIKISDSQGWVKSPIWSPDSRMIAFNRLESAGFKANELLIVPLTEDYKPAASPTIIELPSIASTPIRGWSSNNKIGVTLHIPRRTTINMVPASGGIATQVAPSGKFEAQWSADGQRILFHDYGTIFSMSAKGGQASTIPISEMEELWSPDVSPDGTELVFSGIKKGISGIHLFTVSVNGGEPFQLTSDSLFDFSPSWSPDGKWIAFIRTNRLMSSMYVLPANGGEIRQLVASTDASRPVYYGQLAWSPDGKAIAYPSHYKDTLRSINVISIEGGNPDIVAELEPNRQSSCVAWSPDGKKLTYGSYDYKYSYRGTSGDLWMLPLDTKRPVRLQTGLDCDEVGFIDWSPDGEKMLFEASWVERSDFYLVEDFLPLDRPATPKPSEITAEPKGMSTRMVWSGGEIYPGDLGRISPDGRFVCFSNRMMGDLSILELASKEIRLLTNNWAAWAVVDTIPEEYRPALVDSLLKFGRNTCGSVWSPDASQLAYGWIAWSEENGDLCLMGRDGTDTMTLTAPENVKNLTPYDWSKDGEYILAGAPVGKDSTRLLTISVTDGSSRGLDTIEAAPWDFEGGYFSPNGQHVAYTSPDNDIFLLSVDGEGNQPLIEHPARDYLLGWSPDGRWVCFASDRSGTMDAWLIGVSDGKPQGEPRKVSRNVGEIIPLGITDEGSLYYGLESGISDVYVATIDAQAGQLVTPPKKITQRFEGTNDWPDWSPDGKYLLYRSDRDAGYDLGAKSPFCEREMETGKGREVFVQLKSSRAHHYSPDGRYAIVQGINNNDQNGLFQIDLESGQSTMLVKCSDGTRIRWVTWSPDGKKLFYKYMVTSTQPTRLTQYDLETQQEKELFRENSWPTCPALSPDGQWLAFQTFDDEKMIRSLNILPADGGQLREIVRLEEEECIYSVDWMPDGESILYVKGTFDGEIPRELWQVSIEGGSPRNTGLTMNRMYYLSIHPDGRQIAFSAYKNQMEIWVMENFLPE